MAAKTALRTVKPGETATARRKAPTKLATAVDQSELDFLMATRAKLAAELDAGVSNAYLAPITRQLRDIDREVRALQLRATEEAAEDGPIPDEDWDPAAAL